jgi:hypothetical protein
MTEIQQYPLRSGEHSLAELRQLRASGMSYGEIAVQWQMRPRAGERDLLHEVRTVWEQAGAPGKPDRPSRSPRLLPEERKSYAAAVWCAVDEWLQEVSPRTYVSLERDPDGHARSWLLYRPEPFAPWSDDDRSIHLWVRRCDVFTSRVTAIAFLDNLLGYQVTWQPYNEAFPELWIGWARGNRWLLCPAPVDPPGGER